MAEETATKDLDKIEKVAIKPYDPVGTVGNLRSMLEPRMDSLRAILPRHVTPDRLMKTLLIAVNRQPDLLLCTQESILESISRSAELGLDISGTLGEGYLVPFNNKIKAKRQDGTVEEKWAKQALFIPGYRGLVKLARQSGELKSVDCDVVYEKDEFEFERGMSPKCRFVPNFREKDRGAVLGAYVVFMLTDGAVQMDFMTKAEIEKVRQKSKAKDSLMWTDHWNEGAKKTVIRRGSKLLPMSSEKFVAAIAASDDEFEFDDRVISVTKAPVPDLETPAGAAEAEEMLDSVKPAGEEPPAPPQTSQGDKKPEKLKASSKVDPEAKIDEPTAQAIRQGLDKLGIPPKAVEEFLMTKWGIDRIGSMNNAQALEFSAWAKAWKPGESASS